MKPSSHTSAVIEILESIENSSIPADKVISFWNQNNRYAGSKDKNTIAKTVYDILRHRGELSWWIEKLGFDVNVRTIIITYFHFWGKNPVELFNDDNNKFAPNDLTKPDFELIKSLSSNKKLGDKDMPEYVQLNVQSWLYDKFKEVYGDETFHAINAMNKEGSVDIRVNTLKSNIDMVRNALKQNNIDALDLNLLDDGLRLKKRYALSSLEAFKNGLFEIQDYGSQLASKLIGAKKGDKIVDFCAGAGGKTLAMAQDMENTGRIIYCDVSEKRLNRASIRLRRSGVNNAEKRVLSSERDKWIKRRTERLDGGFDRVVIDAPCSGTGTWRRNPDQKWRTTENTLNELVELQENILQSASRLTRPGGKIIYITCSLLAEENENQINKFIKNNDDFDLCDIKEIWKDTFNNPLKSAGKTLRISPHNFNSDGFFIAVITRKYHRT
ncbi:MAG: RsmB/NOP family class I SAM-dependent RNA methyltransferase [Alphaproteobacteria bacterium]